MPSCSVDICKNTTSKVNYVNNGISFHIYPKDPALKEIWRKATGRDSVWAPTKYSTICSDHFQSNCFQPLKKVRRLFEWAVPTLKLRTIFVDHAEPSTSKMSDDSGLINSSFQVETELENVCEKMAIFDPSKPLNRNEMNESPRKRNLRQLISTQKQYIKKQNSVIKRLQKKNQQYLKKITDLRIMALAFAMCWSTSH